VQAAIGRGGRATGPARRLAREAVARKLAREEAARVAHAACRGWEVGPAAELPDAILPRRRRRPPPRAQGRVVEFAEKPKGDALKAMAVDTTVGRRRWEGGVAVARRCTATHGVSEGGAAGRAAARRGRRSACMLR
jgi:hypothetical protein